MLSQSIPAERDNATLIYVRMLVKVWEREHKSEDTFALILSTSHIVSLMSKLGLSGAQLENHFGLKILRCDIQYPTLAKLY